MDLKFYEPTCFRTQHKSNRQASNENQKINPELKYAHSHTNAYDAITEHHRNSLELYNELIEKGVCREQARGVLPQNLYTEYYGTTNLSNLLKFVDLRTHAGAQWEIQKVAQACLEIAYDLFPETVGAYRSIKSEN